MVFVHYKIKFIPEEPFACKMLIQVSSVPMLNLTLLCVCVTIMAVTSSDVWLLDVKCCETGS